VSSTIEPILEAGSPFRLGEWLVEPSLNRVSRGEESLQLELKAMDVLVYLAERAGQVVDKRELVDSIWQTEYVSDNTLTRRVAELRDALGDDARRPRYIETIPKRGYRLIAEVGHPAELNEAVAPFPERAPTADDRGPFPGLASFTEADTEDFFGRGPEVAALWRKVTSRRLLAVAGPSGVGKSSLVRAGVVARAPAGWGAVVCQPGEDPLLGLARALAPDFSGEVEEVRELLRFHDPDVALAVTSRWRGRWDQALVVVDQFEELFTLNSPQAQEDFVAMLRRLVDAAGIHVVLILRDDFLYECHRFPELEPILRDLTLVGPPRGLALRRALTEPVTRRLHRFESDLMLDEMVAEVERERGALPLLAFAAARLWELRDHGQRLLTRESYDRIGGVGGALAQHAEETMDAIGSERLPIVRELFRNLVTAQGTRAAREVDELLSIFRAESLQEAREVLSALIDARLLTAYQEDEAPRAGSESTPRRVEIVHESLLEAWPRLVRWRAQDAEGALLRDQLRHTAQLWHARGRPRDLLWTGASYREFRLWQERYSGGLSALEEEFAEAMIARAGRRVRRRRIRLAVLVGVLAVIAVVVTALWQRSERSSRRVEAKRLGQLGREAIGRAPPEALAFAIASLGLADDLEARLLAMDALARSPMPMVMHPSSFANLPVGAQFSPDGRWLSVGQIDGHMILVDAAGRRVASWRAAERASRGYFTPDSSALVVVSVGDQTATAWSVPGGSLLGSVGRVGRAGVTEVPGFDAANFDRCLRWIRSPARPGGWSFDPWPLTHLGPVDLGSAPRLAADPRGSRIAIARGREIRMVEPSAGGETEGEIVGLGASKVMHLALDPKTRWVASHGENGEIELWSLDDPRPKPYRVWQGPERTVCNDLRFDPSGSILAGCYDDASARLWSVDAPPGADPVILRPPCNRMVETGFHPGGGLVATAGLSVVALWPLEPGRHPRVLRGHTGEVEQLAFGPDGRFLVSGATDGTIRYWPLEPTAGGAGRVLFDWGHPIEAVVGWVDVSRDGQFAVATGRAPSVRVISLEDGSVRELGDFDQAVFRAAIDPSGTAVALAGYRGGRYVVRIFALGTEAVTEIEVPQPEELHEQIGTLQFLADGRLLLSPCGTISEWRPGEERARPLMLVAGKFAATPDGRMAIARPRPDRHPPYLATVYDLERGTSTVLTSHGDKVHSLALDPTGRIAVTGSFDGVVRVGRATGEAPHHLVAGSGWASGVAVSPDGGWIAAGYKDGSIRLWPMPDLSKAPMHGLPRRGFLARIEALTNLRAAPDPDNPGDYLVAPTAPFPGWESVPTD
jgi:DNA-binding winged helix-turn-helix (wHTH) protein/WD40 repeat protein